MDTELKPDFEKLAKFVIGLSTLYGKHDAPIGSSQRSYYETEINGFKSGASYTYNTYVTPFQSQLSEAEKRIKELELTLSGTTFFDPDEVLKSKNERLLSALKEAVGHVYDKEAFKRFKQLINSLEKQPS
jgi:hypothetical protein